MGFDGNDPLEQLGNEGRRFKDLLGGRGYWRGRNWNRTPGGCGSNLLALVLIVSAVVLLIGSA